MNFKELYLEFDIYLLYIAVIFVKQIYAVVKN